MRRPRDSQRSKVYAWELANTENYTAPTLSLTECRELVRRVWAAYRPGAQPPEFADGRGVSRGGAWGSFQISLPKRSRTRPNVLHETAHTLLASQPYASHGPEWLRLQIELLARLAGFRRADLLRSARGAGLRVARSVPLRATGRLRASGALRPPPCTHLWEGTALAVPTRQKRLRNSLLLEVRTYDEYYCRKCDEKVRRKAT